MAYLINRKRFILDNIEALLKAALSPANIEASFSTQSLAELQLLLDNSGNTAIESLRAFRYQVPPVDFQRLCQQNYSDLFRLQDHVAAWQQDSLWDTLSLDAKAFYAALDKMLHGVQIFLESTGIRGMAAEELLPACYLEKQLSAMTKNINLLRSRFLSAAADPALQDLLVAHFQSFCTRREVRQQELWYMEELMEAILAGLSTSKAEDNELFLMHELVKWNFNSPEGYGYCRDKLMAAFGEISGSKGQLQELIWQQKGLKQLLCVPGMALNHDYPSLKELLLELLSTEIAYQETTVAESVLTAAANSELLSGTQGNIAAYSHSKWQKGKLKPQGDAHQQLPGSDKFQLQLNQRVLAIWTQVLMSMQILKVGIKGQRRFTQFLADHFTTAGMETIQPESFHRRYKEKHSGSCEILITILEQMIMTIRYEYIGINIPIKK